MRTAWILGSLLGLLVVTGAQAQEVAEEPVSTPPTRETITDAVRGAVVHVRLKGPVLARAWGMPLSVDTVLVNLSAFPVPGRRFRVATADGLERDAELQRVLSGGLALLTLAEPLSPDAVLPAGEVPDIGARVLIPYLSESYSTERSLESLVLEPAVLSAATWAALGVPSVRASKEGLPVLTEEGRVVGVVFETDDRFHRVATLKSLESMIDGEEKTRRTPPFEPGLDFAASLPGQGALTHQTQLGQTYSGVVLAHLRFGITGPIGPLRIWLYSRGLVALGGPAGFGARLDTAYTGTFAVGPDFGLGPVRLTLRGGGGLSIASTLDPYDSSRTGAVLPWVEGVAEAVVGPLLVGITYAVEPGANGRGSWLLLEVGVRIPLNGVPASWN